jgi:type I restriction enzyme S subunit
MENQLIPQLKFSSFKGSNYSLVKFGSVIKDSGYGPRFNGNDYDVNGNVKTIRGTDISLNGEIKYKQVPIANLDETFIKNHILEDGDLVMITTADCGLTGVFRKQDINYIPSAYAVKISLKETASPIYFKYFFQTSIAKNQINRFVRKATVANLPGSDIPKLNINIPQLPEQQKIASFLTDVDEVITKLTKKKNLLEQYKKGVMQKIFNQELRFKDDEGNAFPKWENKKLGKLTSVITKGTTPTSLGFSYLKDGVNFVKVECINNTGFIDIQSTPKVSQECNIALKRSELKNNDILFSIAGTLGRTALVKEKDLPANINQALAIIRLKSGVNLSFINYSLNTDNIVKYILKMVSVGAQPNLNLQQVGDITINLPCIREQTKIADFLSDIDIKIEALNTKIENSKTLKKGLLQKMFV